MILCEQKKNLLLCVTTLLSIAAPLAGLSICVGIAAFSVTWRWFPIADMLRSVLLDAAVAWFAIALPLGAGRIWIGVAFFPLLISAVAAIAHLLWYDAPISPFAVLSLFETSPAESLEFFQDHASLPAAATFLAGLGVAFALLIRAWRKLPTMKELTFRFPGLKLGILAFCLVVAGTALHKGDRLLRSHHLYLLADGLRDYAHTSRAVEHIRAKRAGFAPAAVVAPSARETTPRVHVFVIGESANRNHLALYGYPRDTTPHISAMLRQDRQAGGPPQVFAFTNVISSDTHTIPNLRAMFLFQDLRTDENPLSSPSLLQLFKAAGFKTWWLSNQVTTHTALSTALIANDAHVTRYVNTARDEGRSASYDEALLPELDVALEDAAPRKAIFLHLLGSHLTYALRYPPEFNFFTETGDIPDAPWRGSKEKGYINAYDNSIRYTDALLARIIAKVERSGGISSVLYVSDHGQEVYDTRPVRGQAIENPSRHTFDVPFLLWFSPAYQALYPDVVATAAAHRDIPFITSHFAHAAADLARIRFTGFQRGKSLFAPEYTPHERILPGNRPYDTLDEIRDRSH